MFWVFRAIFRLNLGGYIYRSAIKDKFFIGGGYISVIYNSRIK